MIKDHNLRLIFIPLLGISIPYLAGLFSYKNAAWNEIILSNLYFVFISFVIWRGSNWIHGKLRPYFKIGSNSFAKILTIATVSSLYGMFSGITLTILWLKLSGRQISWESLARFTAFVSLAVIVFTLVYEVLFLSKEREFDNHMVHQLDRERSIAELTALKNELDPHFIFNAMNTLSHLIKTDTEKAWTFNHKLASVYKYFLINTKKNIIAIEDELEFIDNYFYLLKIRHDHNLTLSINIANANHEKIKVLPCALQVLVENAIKHNEFTDDNPLHIEVELNGKYLNVSNNVKPKPYLPASSSTGIGLKNLSARYKISCQKDIEIEKTQEKFTVKLPLIT